MAEEVQATLDDMVAPLSDLQERGIFSEDEISAIVTRRRESEYRLRRLNPRLSDYLEYLNIEEKLEELRRLRTIRLTRKDSNHNHTHHTNQKFIGDTHGIRFLHLLWIRTLRKFRSVEMYLQYAEFCNRVKSYPQLSRCFQEALSFFPQSVDLWIGAASHEYFRQHSMRAARILLQRALRIHGTSSELWIQYFTLELHWRCKLMGRKMILQEESHDDDAVVPDKEEEMDHKDPYAVAKLVYQEAIKSKAASPELPWQFVTACQDFPVKELQEWIVEGLSHDNENAWIIHAKYLASADSAESTEPPRKRPRTDDPAIALLKQACESLPTSNMYVQAIQFLDEYMTENNASKREFQDKLFADATEQRLINDELLALRLDHLPPKDGILLLKQHTKTMGGNLWIKYAALELEETGEEEKAAAILETALTKIPVNKPEYIVMLVQLVGVQIACEGCSEDVIAKLVHRLVLLAPANAMAFCDEPIYEHSRHVPAVLDAYLERLVEGGMSKPQKSLESILSSKCMPEWVLHASESVDSIIDHIIRMEESSKKQAVLYERAIKIVQDTPLADKYRLRRDNELRYRATSTEQRHKFQIPTVLYSGSNSDIIVEDNYKKFQVCFVRKVVTTSGSKLGWKNLSSLFESLGEEDKASWCIENVGATEGSLLPSEMLDSGTNGKKIRAYCSFLVQKDEKSRESTLRRLPFKCFHPLPWVYESALWFFFGRNPSGNLPLQGRPEHTDSVYHDGTWHYQLSGSKRWFLRPTNELLEELPELQSTTGSFEVECNEGDVLLVNTRLWFHRTEIPAQVEPSVSYARDFRIATVQCKPVTMTNVDGLYATDDISVGHILFTEENMPGCELHRSSDNPNCELVELDTGLRAVVSLRQIKSGEFFCLAESDDDGGDSSGEEEQEDASSTTTD